MNATRCRHDSLISDADVVNPLSQAARLESMSDGPFIDEIAPLGQLRAEYIDNDNKVFVKQIDYLWGQGFQIRRTKGTLRRSV
jgi:ubiquitin thioesterase protein OTUB1